jgi:hypothetical protein
MLIDDEQDDSIVQKVLRISDDPEFAQMLRNIDEEHVNELLESITPRLFKILVQHERTRIRSIHSIIEKIRTGTLRGSEAFSCLSELHVSLYNVRDSSVEDAKEFLLSVTEEIMSLVNEKKQIEDISDLIGVLPSIIGAAQNVDNSQNGHSTISKQILDKILAPKMFPSKLLISLVNVFVDITIEDERVCL